MKETFGCIVGLSDHSLGSAVPVASIALGASVIEKHLTIKRSDGGPDGLFSMEPDEFKSMIIDIKNVSLALGHPTYTLTEKQKLSRERGRSLYVSSDIKAGEFFNENNIKSIRPGYGLHPKYYETVIGKKAKVDLKKGIALRWEYIDE